MKKTWFLTLCALLLAALLAGCGGTAGEPAGEAAAEPPEAAEPGIAGSWTAEVDMADTLNETLSEAEEIGKYLNLESFSFRLLAEFREDGTYSMHCDPDSARAALDGLKEQMKGALSGYLEDIAKESGLDLTAEELMEQAGITMDDLLAEMDEAYSAEDMVGDMELSGKYLFENGTLALSDDPETDPDPNDAETVTLEGDTLTFTGGGEDSQFAGLYPVVFHRGDQSAS